jgi:hypothetical protein
MQSLQYAREICVRDQAVGALQGECRREGCARVQHGKKQQTSEKAATAGDSRDFSQNLQKAHRNKGTRPEGAVTFEDEENIR